MIRLIFTSVLLLAVVAMTALGVDVARFFSLPLDNHGTPTITVKKGASFRTVAQTLRRQHVLSNQRDVLYLSLYARLTGAANQIKSGQYEIPARKRPRRLVHLLVSGDTYQHKLTLIEGWRFSQIRAAIEHDKMLKHTLKGDSSAQIMAAIGHPGQDPEGRFMPDTYLFPKGTTDKAFLKRAYRKMHDFLQASWKQRATNTAVKTPYQALILASIVEKETAAPAERRRIAGVYSRRLRKGMRLQADPTVIFGIKNFEGTIHKSDLRRDTPYNTYRHKGLPPTPIAAPSRASIRAALHPARGRAIYFVSRGNGTHVFSDTLSGQRKAIRKYQKNGS